jgi:hypothetical protein
MEHGDLISENCNNNFLRHVGYTEDGNPCIQKYFSNNTVQTIKKKVTELTLGVDPQNRPIVVSDDVICNLMSEIYNSFRPATGDIFTRYIIPSGTTSVSYVNDMINQVIEVLVSNIKNTTMMDENNKKLTVWTTVLGDFNEHNLRSHSVIKVRNKRPAPFQFNMNY